MLKKNIRRFGALALILLMAVWPMAAFAAGEATAAAELGVNYIERRGIGFSLDKQMSLRDGDLLQSCISSRIRVQAGESQIVMDESVELRVNTAATDGFSAELMQGTLFAVAEDAPLAFQFAEKSFVAQDAVLLLDVRTGSQTLSVLRGNVSVTGASDISATAGECLSFVGEDALCNALELVSLSAFALENAISASADHSLFCETEEFQQIVDAREAERQKALMDKLAHETAVLEQGGTEQEVSEVFTGSSASGAGNYGSVCTITIRCDTILENMVDLTEGKNVYVPANGCILATSTVGFAEGETVFDVLKRVCSAAGIQLEYSWTPMYGSYYIEGINHLYEFDCGEQSGWMYKVNGWFPNYGCSSYTLKDGDSIVWCFTCKGLGADVGGSVY